MPEITAGDIVSVNVRLFVPLPAVMVAAVEASTALVVTWKLAEALPAAT